MVGRKATRKVPRPRSAADPRAYAQWLACGRVLLQSAKLRHNRLTDQSPPEELQPMQEHTLRTTPSTPGPQITIGCCINGIVVASPLVLAMCPTLDGTELEGERKL
jgi:hypothetical protein